MNDVLAAPRTDAAPSAASSPTSADDAAFGEHAGGRFGADVEYRGRAGEHGYVVRVRHRLLDTAFTVEIDGVEHDPVAEEKAQKAAEKAGRSDGETVAAAEGKADGEGQDGEAASSPDGLRFRVEEGFTTLTCTVRRVRAEGELEDCEVLLIRTSGLGGAGEVEVRHGFRTTVLVPAEGSPSAARDARRTAHPTRYALLAALTKSAKYLIPLLGLGALFGGLLDPLEEWVEARIRPAMEAIAEATAPVREWIANLVRPVVEFFDALLSPVRELIGALIRPVVSLLEWLRGLLPDIGLPFGIPDWLIDLLVPVIVVLVVFSATRSSLQRRREQLAESADAADGEAPEDSADPPTSPSDRSQPRARNASRSAGESSTQN